MLLPLNTGKNEEIIATESYNKIAFLCFRGLADAHTEIEFLVTSKSTAVISADQQRASSWKNCNCHNKIHNLCKCYNPKVLVNQSERLAIINPANTCNSCQM